jgi:hypothetical protein
MIFTNPQTALIYDWMDANIYVDDIYQECLISENFGLKLANTANSVWKSIHPTFKELDQEFYPIFWDEVAEAFTEKLRFRLQKYENNFLTKNF